jgi:hypothetical protein
MASDGTSCYVARSSNEMVIYISPATRVDLHWGTFAGKVGTSLLNAINLPELITATLEDHERIAIELATDPEKLAEIKQKLDDNRLTTPLFDTRQFTKHIEAAYTTMYERERAGLPRDHFSVAN